MVGYLLVLTLRLAIYTLLGKARTNLGKNSLHHKLCTPVHLWIRILCFEVHSASMWHNVIF